MRSSKITVRPTARSGITTRFLVVMLVLILAAMGSAIFYVRATWVEGIELNPVTWQVRKFQFRADPFTNIQWTGLKHDTTVFTVDPGILSKLSSKARPDAQPDAQRWDLVELRTYRRYETGGARILAMLLTDYRFGFMVKSVSHWSAWSAANPQKSAALWPAVQHLAVFNAYADIPSLIELALILKDDQNFLDQLNQQMRLVLIRLGDKHLQETDYARALATARTGLSYSPEDSTLLAIVQAAEAKLEVPK